MPELVSGDKTAMAYCARLQKEKPPSSCLMDEFIAKAAGEFIDARVDPFANVEQTPDPSEQVCRG